MTEPLSPAAEAVLRADAAARCLFEWDSVNDPPCHPSDHDWNGCIRCVNRLATAAALRAAAGQVVPEETSFPNANEPEARERFNTPEEWLYSGIEQDQRQATRTAFLTLANELDPTP